MNISTERADRVRSIHENAFIIDGHFDLSSDLLNRRERGVHHVVRDTYLPSFKQGGFDALVSAIFIDDYFLPEMGLRRALDQISALHDEIAETPGLFRICTSVGEAEAAKRAGELAIFLSLEGAEPLQDDIHLLQIFYQLGVRALGLVWNRRNHVADGSCQVVAGKDRSAGLTTFGVEVVERAEELGMVIDVSHLGDRGFWDLVEVAKNPFVASHSNCRSIAPHMRNLTDQQITALADTGGVIGMNCIVNFITENKSTVTVEHLVDHVDHIVNLAGVEHVALGFDFCDGFADFCQMGPSPNAGDLLPNHSALYLFTSALVQRGYSDKQIYGILGGNLSRVYRDVCGSC